MVDVSSYNNEDNNDDELQIRQTFSYLDQSQILLCRILKRAYILVDSEALVFSRSRGKALQNDSAWEVVVTTADDLEFQIEEAFFAFGKIDGMTSTVSERLVEHGFLSLRDVNRLSVLRFMELCGIDEQKASYVLQEIAKALK